MHQRGACNGLMICSVTCANLINDSPLRVELCILHIGCVFRRVSMDEFSGNVGTD